MNKLNDHHHNTKVKMYDSSGSSGNEADPNQQPSDYFPNIHDNKLPGTTSNLNKSPFTPENQMPGSSTVYPVKTSHNIIIKQGGINQSFEAPARITQSSMMQSYTSDVLSVRESNGFAQNNG